MKTRLAATVFGFASILLAASPIWAHHGSTGFDQKKPVHLVGKVSLLEWMNPHIYFYVDVKDDASGKVTNYACEGGAATFLGLRFRCVSQRSTKT